jgi:uncharacterized protein (TIGR03435 family)
MTRLPFWICGVRGGDLARRIDAIMTERRRPDLTRSCVAALMFGGFVVATAPVVVGALTMQSKVQPIPPSDRPHFEVASIKRSSSGLGPASMRSSPDGQVTATRLPLKAFLSRGWGAFETEEGMPSWMTSDQYDVAVKPPAGATADELRQMWRNLFAERLKLSAHLAPRETPAYALVVARADGRLGSRLQPAVLDCGQAGSQHPRPGPDAFVDAEKRCDLITATGRMVSGSAPLDQFANLLAAWAGRPVVNATNLTGRFAIDLRFSVPAQGGQPAGGNVDSPDIFTALREQLGLKLEPSRTQVNILIIDHIERPTEN